MIRHAALLLLPLIISTVGSTPLPSSSPAAPLTIESTISSISAKAKHIAERIWKNLVAGFHNIADGKVKDSIKLQRMNVEERLVGPKDSPTGFRPVRMQNGGESDPDIIEADETQWILISVPTAIWSLVVMILVLCCCSCICSSCR